MPNIHAVQLEPGQTRYFVGKAEALKWGRNHSVQVDHVVPVYECEMIPNTTRLEGLVHALNGQLILSTRILGAYRRGRSVKGWGDDTQQKMAETLTKLRTVVGESP